MKREGIRYPAFADKFYRIDFEADPMPVLCMYPIPEYYTLDSLRLSVCGLDLAPRTIAWKELAALPRVRIKAPLICSIFNWAEVVEWEGIPLASVLSRFGVETGSGGYYAFYSRDGHYFETLSREEAHDPRVLLAYGLNGKPLPPPHGGPLRLVVPFLQGYKSVKWIRGIRAFLKDPMGIKRLRGQSQSAELTAQWRERYGIVPPGGVKP